LSQQQQKQQNVFIEKIQIKDHGELLNPDKKSISLSLKKEYIASSYSLTLPE